MQTTGWVSAFLWEKVPLALISASKALPHSGKTEKHSGAEDAGMRPKPTVEQRCHMYLRRAGQPQIVPINSLPQGSSTFAAVTSLITPSSIPTRCSLTPPSGRACPWLAVTDFL